MRYPLKSGADAFFYLTAAAAAAWGIEPECLRPLVRTPRELLGLVVEPAALQWRVLALPPEPLAALPPGCGATWRKASRPASIGGRPAPADARGTACRALTPAPLLWPRFVHERHAVWLNPAGALENQTFYGVIPDGDLTPALAAVLNSSLGGAGDGGLRPVQPGRRSAAIRRRSGRRHPRAGPSPSPAGRPCGADRSARRAGGRAGLGAVGRRDARRRSPGARRPHAARAGRRRPWRAPSDGRSDRGSSSPAWWPSGGSADRAAARSAEASVRPALGRRGRRRRSPAARARSSRRWPSARCGSSRAARQTAPGRTKTSCSASSSVKARSSASGERGSR